MTYLDVQAAVGITKHLGGLGATRRLLALCGVGPGTRLLDVGCGIGVGPAHAARALGCRVVGVDLSTQMVGWARQRARQQQVADRVALSAADVLALPFPDGCFDVVVCESVLDFVTDKAAALAECVRVVRPGGRVGLNEALWVSEPPAELAAQVEQALGPSVPTGAGWQALWAASGLEDRVVRLEPLRPAAELVSRIRWIGWPWLLRAWARLLRLLLRRPALRRSVRRQVALSPAVVRLLAYGLFAGTKPAPSGVGTESQEHRWTRTAPTLCDVVGRGPGGGESLKRSATASGVCEVGEQAGGNGPSVGT